MKRANICKIYNSVNQIFQLANCMVATKSYAGKDSFSTYENADQRVLGAAGGSAIELLVSRGYCVVRNKSFFGFSTVSREDTQNYLKI